MPSPPSAADQAIACDNRVEARDQRHLEGLLFYAERVDEQRVDELASRVPPQPSKEWDGAAPRPGAALEPTCSSSGR